MTGMRLEDFKSILMAPGFDVEEHASHVIQTNGAGVADYVAALGEAERELDIKLEDHVSTHHQELLNQATGVERLEDRLQAVSGQSASLMAAVEKSMARVSEPYERIWNQTLTLARLQETCDLMRRIIRILQLGKRLQNQLNPSSSSVGGGKFEITKAAQSLSEFQELWEPESDLLNRIEAIDQEKRLFRHARTDIERKADAMITYGMESKSQTQTGTALQVYFNLGILGPKILKILKCQIDDTKKCLTDSLDAKKIGEMAAELNPPTVTTQPGKIPKSPSVQGANSTHFRSQLWTNIENALDFIHTKCCELMQIQKVLCKKRDQVGLSFGESLAREFENDVKNKDKRHIVTYAWLEMLKITKECFQKGTVESPLIKQALEGEYPKLVRLFNELWHRLCQAAHSSVAADPSIKVEHPFNPNAKACEDVLQQFERSYLSRSLSRLFDPVNLMFSSKTKDKTISTPTSQELDQIFRVITSELTISNKVDMSLCLAVSRNVAKTVNLMCNKCEQMMVIDDEASQVVGYPTEDQRANVALSNCLYKFKRGVEAIVSHQNKFKNFAECEAVVQSSLEDVNKVIKTVIENMIASIKDACEAIILTMHHEPGFQEDGDPEEKISPYVKELKTFVFRVTDDFINPFDCKKLVAELFCPLVTGLVDQFVLHVSLVRPLGSSGQKRLSYDSSKLREILDPFISLVTGSRDRQLCAKIEEAFRQVTVVKDMLYSPPEDFLEMNQLHDGSVRYSTALHFMFSKSPAELKSPHESAEWSITRYSQWLEDHQGEADRLQLIQGALESYVAGTRMRREKSYVAPYPIMLKLLQSALDDQ